MDRNERGEKRSGSTAQAAEWDARYSERDGARWSGCPNGRLVDDPADYVGADDLARLLGNEFTIELHAVEPRIDPPPESPHIADVVLRARYR